MKTRICFLLALLVLTVGYVYGAPQESIGLICDTPEQVEQFARTADGKGANAALEEVNGNDVVCVVMPVRFNKHEAVKTIDIRGKTYAVVRIMVFGGKDAEGWWKVDPPVEQFTVYERRNPAVSPAGK